MNLFYIIFSYLLGSIPFGYIITKLSTKKNILEIGWRKTSGSNVFKNVGKWQGILTGVFDVLKGFFAVRLAQNLDLSTQTQVLSGVAAVAGQMWPPSPNWHGEKGNTTGAGVIITLALIYHAYLILLALIPFTIGAALRYYSLASGQGRLREPTHPLALALPVGMFLGFAVAPIASWRSGEPESITLGLLALFIIIVVRRLTCDLKSDVERGDNVVRILANRFLFDQPSIDGGAK